MGTKDAEYGEGIRMMANLATASSVEDVLAQTELIGVYLLGTPPRRVPVAGHDIGVLQHVRKLEVDGAVLGQALVARLGDVAIAWTGRRFQPHEIELLAPVIPVAQRALERIVGTPSEPEASLRAQGPAHLISALVEQIADPVWVLDTDFRLRAFNSAFAQFLKQAVGVTAAIGSSVLAIPEPYRTTQLKIYRGVLRYGPRRMDWQVPGADEIYDVYMHPIEHGGGIAVICRDVTATRVAAHALEVARQEADLANQAKTDFLAQMSHEFRTPLNAIVGLTDLMLGDDELTPGLADRLRKVQLSSRSLLHLVSGVLDFSRIEAGRLDVKPTPMDLPATVREAFDVVDERARAKGLGLKLILSEGLPQRILSDPHRLRQVLVILLDNAVKYTSDGVVTLRVSGGDVVVFEVADTGMGIREEHLDRIFRRYFRGGGPRSTGGAGLGLAIAQRLVRALDGRIEVESTVGEGSVFRVELPVEVVRWRPESSPGPSGALRRPLSLLVVDDAPTNLAVTAAILRRGGHQVGCVTSGEAALEQADGTLDLILMDVDMPGMDGLETTRALAERGVDVPVLGLTAHAVDAILEACIHTGMVGVLVKPIQPASLDEQVLRHARPVRVWVEDGPMADEVRGWLVEVGAEVADEPSTAHACIEPSVETRDALLAEVQAQLSSG